MIKIISYDDIPFDELTNEYLFANKMAFKPVKPFKSKIVAQHGHEDQFGNSYMYQEWEDGHKILLIREVTGNPPANHVKANYELEPTDPSDFHL